MGNIIDTKKSKKHRKMIKCDCLRCVNREKKGCRFGWEPINGKCNRFGTNHYTLSRDEKKHAREQSKINKEKYLLEKKEAEKIRATSMNKINDYLETNLDLKTLRSVSKYRNFGNGRFSVKYIGSEDEDIVSIKFRDKKVRKYKIIK